MRKSDILSYVEVSQGEEVVAAAHNSKNLNFDLNFITWATVCIWKTFQTFELNMAYVR